MLSHEFDEKIIYDLEKKIKNSPLKKIENFQNQGWYWVLSFDDFQYRISIWKAIDWKGKPASKGKSQNIKKRETISGLGKTIEEAIQNLENKFLKKC